MDWWLCNEIEGNELTGKEDPMDIVTDLCQRFPKSNVLLTLGKEGSSLASSIAVSKEGTFYPILNILYIHEVRLPKKSYPPARQ